jgi:predicted RNase H-like nuclease (RuvC/YqgF family)
MYKRIFTSMVAGLLDVDKLLKLSNLTPKQEQLLAKLAEKIRRLENLRREQARLEEEQGMLTAGQVRVISSLRLIRYMACIYIVYVCNRLTVWPCCPARSRTPRTR